MTIHFGENGLNKQLYVVRVTRMHTLCQLRIYFFHIRLQIGWHKSKWCIGITRCDPFRRRILLFLGVPTALGRSTPVCGASTHQ